MGVENLPGEFRGALHGKLPVFCCYQGYNEKNN
jgi:hypothetical protein